MPAISVPRDSIRIGAGFLYKAPIGSALPSNTVVGSVFTDAWPGAWIPVGVTAKGHEFSVKPNFDPVEAAEYLYPLLMAPTKTESKVALEIIQFTAKNFGTVLNGGPVTTVSGTGATLLTKYTEPASSGITRTMLGWESEDAKERCVWYQCLQTGEVKVTRNKGGSPSSLPAEFMLEQPSSGQPWDGWVAGTVAVGN